MHKLGKALLLSMVALVAALLIDDELSLESKALIDAATPHDVSSAGFYLLGIDASPETDPLLVGRERYVAIQQADALMNRTRSDVPITDGFGGQRLEKLKGDVHCALFEEGCVNSILQNQDQIHAELTEHHLLLKRYETFMAMRGFRTLSIHRNGLPSPQYRAVIDGNRLLGLSAVHKALIGAPQQAIEWLQQNEANIRAKLVESDDLLDKMVLVALLSENIDRMVLVNHLSGRHPTPIDPLTELEASFDLAIAREFKSMKTLTDDIFLRQDHGSIGILMTTPFYRMVVKPNLTMNTLQVGAEQMSQFAQLDPLEFQESADTPIQNHRSLLSKLRNYHGDLLAEISNLDYRRFFVRSYNVGVKIDLYNHLAASGKQSISTSLNQFENPYYRETGRAFIPEQSESVCFDGPLENARRSRCLLHMGEDFDELHLVESSSD